MFRPRSTTTPLLAVGAIALAAALPPKSPARQAQAPSFAKETAELFARACNVAKIYGRIQFVDSFPDYKVKVVTAFPDLRVQKVKSFPDKAGKWQIVTSFPNYKIQLVDSFPDFTIQYVTSFPGVR